MTVISLLTVLASTAWATGKIRGKVYDRDTKEPLVGANVLVVGTAMGAAADVNGEFTILEIPAGTYSLRATFVGYSALTVSNIRVNNTLTTDVSFELAGESVTLQQVEIVAERPLITRDATNAIRITTAEDINSLPVRGVNNILALQAGVVLKDNLIFIRGGRQDEVGFYLEGVSVTNPMVGGAAVTLVQDAIEEVQVQAGGYTAEFGGANAGIIQQQLKTGTADPHFSVHYVTDNISFRPGEDAYSGKKVLGTYTYGYNEFTASGSGPIGDERIRGFGLFNYYFIRDAVPQAYPGIDLGSVSNLGDTVSLVYPGGPLTRNSLNQYNYSGTLTFDYSPMRVRLSGTYTTGTGYLPYNTNRNAGSIANILNSSRIEQVDTWNGTGNLKFTHMLNPTTFYEVTGGYFQQAQKNFDPYLKDNFWAYGDSVANAEAGFIWEREANDTFGRFIRPAQRQIYTFAFNAPGDVTAGYVNFKREAWNLSGAFSSQLGKVHSVKAGVEYQRYTIRNYSWSNEAAFGLAGLIANNDRLPDGDPQKQSIEQILRIRGVNNFGYDVFGNLSDAEGLEGARHPVFLGAYVQDKIEYNDLVVNIGLRYDYIDIDNYAFIDPLKPERSINRTTLELIPDGFVKTKPYASVSPRIGLSFPVTDQTVFHAQFGRFVQQTRLRDSYQGVYLTGSNMRGGFFIGGPVGFDVRPTRTTQYEIGFRQQISDVAAFDITGYYKDIKDQIVYDQVFTEGSQYGAYAVLRNGDFATTKGVEMTLNLRRVQRLQVNATVAFQNAQGTGSFPNSNRGIVGAPVDGVTIFRPQYISPLEFNNDVRGNLNINYRFGRDDGGPVLQELGASALLMFNSGRPFTRGTGGANLEGEARSRSPVEPLGASTTPWVFQVDFRLDKTFRLTEGLSANLYVFVINVFDRRNVENVFLRTGSASDDGYLSDPNLGGQLVETYGQQYASMYQAINLDYYEQWQNAPFLNTVPYLYGPPRQIRLGIRLDY
jgi:hypothetical protein